MAIPNSSMPVPQYVSASEQSHRQQVRPGSRCVGTLTLSERDTVAFNAAADDATPPNAALKNALLSYRRKCV